VQPPKKSGPPRRAGPGGPKRPTGPNKPSGKRPGAPSSRSVATKDRDAKPHGSRRDGDRPERTRTDIQRAETDIQRAERAKADGPRTGAPSHRGDAPKNARIGGSEEGRSDRPRADRARPDRSRAEAPRSGASSRRSDTSRDAHPGRSEGRTERPRADTRPRPPRKSGPKKPAGPANPHPAHAAAESDGKGEPQRIAKLLARAGIASRREIERMIEEGRIAKDGVALDTPATLLTSLHGVTVDGVAVAAPPPARLFLFHKPTGCLTTERDPAGRPTIYDRLPADLPRLMPIGRLDMNTEGLLLLTTDGGFKRQMELPATGVPRTYRARAFGEISQQQLEDLFDGLEIDGIRYGQIEANLERRTGRNQWIEMSLTEGKNREVRRILEHLGLQVNRLIRTAYGPFTLGEMPVGAVEEVRQHDLIQFRNSLKAAPK
jgi:23S rRNA pseudouridine2605 synthase